ncbi:MAG: hypothetical protein GY948_22015 [Alphaproteobacteria bacterium]|nr:hypothetical protein [Alphaproteobacteria bacterium]
MDHCLEVSEAFKAIQRRLDDPSLPPAVRENVEQHFQHLVSLAHNLKQLGVDQKEINHHVAEIYGKYELALDMNLARIKEIEDSIVVADGEVGA